MHIQQVHFDEVFDVQAARGDFSFRSRGRAQYGVNLQCGVIPRAGSSFAVAFEQPGNWDSILGCRDLASTKVMLRRPGWWSMLFQTADILIFGPILVVGGLLAGGMWPGLVMTALLLLAMICVVVRTVRVNRAVERALLCLGDDSGRLDKRGALGAGTVP